MEKIEFKGKVFKGSEGEFAVNDSRFENEPHRIIVYATDNHRMALCFKEGSLIYPRFEEKALANARLFANSKNLLKAAIKVCKEFDDPNDAAEAFKQLETEILKSL